MHQIDIGMAICGNRHEIKIFIDTLHEAFVTKNASWLGRFTSVKTDQPEHQCYLCIMKDHLLLDPYECLYFCKQINKLGFSYAFSYLDPANQTVIQLTNQDRDFFNPIVKQFFKITDEKQFEDKQHKTFKEWMLANFDQTELADLCNHGAQNGFHGLIYYTETSALYNQYQSDIWDALYEEYESLEYKSILELVSSFNGSIQVNSDEQFKNLLVWFVAEKIAFEITEGEYPNDDECENNTEDDE